MKSGLIAAVGVLAIFLAACDSEQETAPEAENATTDIDYKKQFFEPTAAVKLIRSQTLYAPVYSNIFTGWIGHKTELAATLAIHNTDPVNPIYVTKVDYFDMAGKPVKTYLDRTLGLAPMATATFNIKVSDLAGGTGANFIVTWGMTGNVNDPLVETVMIGGLGNRGFAFTTPARVIKSGTK